MRFNLKDYLISTSASTSERSDGSRQDDAQITPTDSPPYDRWVRRELYRTGRSREYGARSSAANDGSSPTVRDLGDSGNLARVRTVEAIFPRRVNRVWRSSFQKLQEWEGYVVDVSNASFTARLIDITNRSPIENEEATIPLDEVSPLDRDRISEGSVFRWVIGFERRAGGSRRRISQIVFRDPPRFTHQDIKAARQWADTMFKWLEPTRE